MSLKGGTARDTQSVDELACGGADWPVTLIGGGAGTGPGVAVWAPAIGELASCVAPAAAVPMTTATEAARTATAAAHVVAVNHQFYDQCDGKATLTTRSAV